MMLWVSFREEFHMLAACSKAITAGLCSQKSLRFVFFLDRKVREVSTCISGVGDHTFSDIATPIMTLFLCAADAIQQSALLTAQDFFTKCS